MLETILLISTGASAFAGYKAIQADWAQRTLERGQLNHAYDHVLDEPIPQDMLERLRKND